MIVKLIRHATMLITIGNVKLLVDPMLAPVNSMEPVVNSPNMRPNPLVPLPVSMPELQDIDALLVTHTHRDHFDDVAANMLSKTIPAFCQPDDENKLKSFGFSVVNPINNSVRWNNMTIIRTAGEHGKGEIGQKMGPVSGFIIQYKKKSLLYITGDTIWCNDVLETLIKYQPQVTIIFSGAAQFLTGGPITMDETDILKLCRADRYTTVVAVHLEAFNHCLLTRRNLQQLIEKESLAHRVKIPKDGEELSFPLKT